MNTAEVYHMNEDQHDRAWLVNFLNPERDWKTASEIRYATGLTPIRIRQLAQIYPTMLVSSGYGYKLARNATQTEKVKCVQSLLHRAEKITARASALAGTL